MEKTNPLYDIIKMKMEEDFTSVKKLGDAIGYGNMMALCSTLWKNSMISNGFESATSGVFYGVPKAAIKEDWIEAFEKDQKIYDEWYEALKEKL